MQFHGVLLLNRVLWIGLPFGIEAYQLCSQIHVFVQFDLTEAEFVDSEVVTWYEPKCHRGVYVLKPYLNSIVCMDAPLDGFTFW